MRIAHFKILMLVFSLAMLSITSWL